MELHQACRGARKPWTDCKKEPDDCKQKIWYSSKPKEDPREVYADIYKVLMENKDGIMSTKITKGLGLSSTRLRIALDSLSTVVTIWEDDVNGKVEYGILE